MQEAIVPFTIPWKLAKVVLMTHKRKYNHLVHLDERGCGKYG